MLGFSALGTTALGAPTANEAYSLQVTSGTFTLSMQGAAKLITDDQNFGLIIDSVYNNASFSLTGQNIVFDTGFGMVIDSGSFALTGQSIPFKKAMNVDLNNATFTLTGQDALKGVGEAFDRGQFTYSGQDVTLFVGRFLRPVSGKYDYTFENFKIRGWLSPTLPPAIWTDVA